MTDPIELQLSLDRLHLTRDIVVAAAASGRAFDLAEAIKAVHAALVSLADPVPAPAEELRPAVPRNKSVFPDRIISLETGELANKITDLMVEFTAPGSDRDAALACCIVASVAADQMRLAYGDEALAGLAEVVLTRHRYPMPPRVQ